MSNANTNLREKHEVHLPRQSAGGVDLSQGTLTGMANMTRSQKSFLVHFSEDYCEKFSKLTERVDFM